MGVNNFDDHKAEVETVLNTIEFADNMSEAMKEAKEVKLTEHRPETLTILS